jgi:hypothetical protein
MNDKVLPLLLITTLALPACAEDPLTLTDGPNPSYEPEMFRAVLVDLTQPKMLPQKGDWPDDFGDANFYGPGFLFRYGEAGGNQLHIELGRQNQTYNAELLTQAMTNLNILMTKLEDVLMAAFGQMEALNQQADAATLKQLDQVLEILNMVGQAIGYYPENSSTVGGYGVDTYGPTTTNSSLALLNLEYALQVGGAKKQERITTAEAILTAGRATAFDSKLGYYQFSSTQPGLYLYPNITQMICHLRLYELTGKQLYLDRAKDLHAAIQPLKVKGEGRYRSPYSAKYMGAKTDDYTTFSSQNFVMIGLSLLYKFTQDAKYKQEITEILKFLRTHLLQGGRVLHHWMDGKLAVPSDPEYYCSGCNLQLLYILHRLDELLAPNKS